MDDNIKNNLQTLLTHLRDYEKKYQRQTGEVALLAVSKNQSVEKMQQAFLAGQKSFGENYLQEALLKIAALKEYAIEWHFIGHIQANKTQKIAENFAWVHSVASEKIAKRLNDQRPLTLPPLNICIEVNVSEQASKSGVRVAETQSLAQYCSSLPRLTLRGLMTIPAPKFELPEQRAEYHKLRDLWQNLRQQGITLDTLSMGMSADLEAGVAEGATIVRIGTALFGSRN